MVKDLLDSSDELRPEDQGVRFGQLQAVFDLVGGVAIIHGNGQRAGLENPEVDGKPLEAIHKQDRYFVPLADATRQQEVRKAVCLYIKFLPRHLASILFRGGGFDQVVLSPRHRVIRLIRRTHLDQADFRWVEFCVSFQKVGDRHVSSRLQLSGCRDNEDSCRSLSSGTVLFRALHR